MSFVKLYSFFGSLLAGQTIAPDSGGFFGSMGAVFGNLVSSLWQSVCSWFYAICKWFLAVVDFLQYFIQKLIGLDYWLKDGAKTFEGAIDGDLLFSFIFNDTVQKVFRAMMGVFFVLLIVFTIFAIIKSEWTYATGGFSNGDNSKVKVMRSAVKAIGLVIIFPLIMIIGIISSNAILASLVNALNIDMGQSFGATLFSISAQSSNKYRIYAGNDQRVAVSDRVTFYIRNSDKKLIAYTDGSSPDAPYTEYIHEYHTYLDLIHSSDVTKYTVNSIFDLVNPSGWGENGEFTGYCVALDVTGEREYYMVRCEPKEKEAVYYYLRNVLEAKILTRDKDKNADQGLTSDDQYDDIYADLKKKMEKTGNQAFIEKEVNLSNYSGFSELIKACHNTWGYSSIFTTAKQFNVAADFGVADYQNALLAFGLGDIPSAKVVYNSDEISSYFDGGQFGVVQKQAEYYVMADAVDFMNDTNVTLHIMDVTSSRINWNSVGDYHFESRWVTSKSGKKVNYGSTNYLPFVVSYSDQCGDTEAGNVLYMAKYGQTSELDGAVYILCYKVEKDGVASYVPVVNGVEFEDPATGKEYTFKSDFLADNYKGLVVAKSPFETQSTNAQLGEPTYIKTTYSVENDWSLKTLFEKKSDTENAYYYQMSETGRMDQWFSVDDTHKIDFSSIAGVSLSEDYPNLIINMSHAGNGTGDDTDVVWEAIKTNESGTDIKQSFSPQMAQDLTIRLRTGSSSLSATYSGQTLVNDSNVAYYMYCTGSGYYIAISIDSEYGYIRIHGIDENGIISAKGDGARFDGANYSNRGFSGFTKKYKLNSTYTPTGGNTITSSITTTLAPNQFEYVKQDGAYAMYRTTDMLFVKITDNNQGIKIEKSMYATAYFPSDSLIQINGSRTIQFANPPSNSITYKSAFFNFQLYDFYTGYVGTAGENGSLHHYNIDSGKIENATPEPIYTIECNVNTNGFSWSEHSESIGLYDGNEYILTIYKSPSTGAITSTSDLLKALRQNTIKILYDYEEYYNIETQNRFSSAADGGTMEQYYDSIRDSVVIGYYRDNAGGVVGKGAWLKDLFGAWDVSLNLLGGLRFKVMLAPQRMSRENIAGYFKLEDGVSFDYFFEQNNTEKLNSIGVGLSTFFQPSKIAYWIILIASALIIKVLGTALWGIIKRFYEITLYFIAMPAVASTMPLDDGKRFNSAIQQPLISRVLSTYGVILGINAFFVLLAPVKSMSNVFTAEDIATSGSYFLKNLSHLFGIVGAGDALVADILNGYIYILFVLVAFTMIEALPSLISQMIGGPGSNIVDEGRKTTGAVRQAINSSRDMISGHSLMESGKNVLNNAKGFIPGSAIFDKARKSAKGFMAGKGKGGGGEGEGSARTDGESNEADSSMENADETTTPSGESSPADAVNGGAIVDENGNEMSPNGFKPKEMSAEEMDFNKQSIENNDYINQADARANYIRQNGIDGKDGSMILSNIMQGKDPAELSGMLDDNMKNELIASTLSGEELEAFNKDPEAYIKEKGLSVESTIGMDGLPSFAILGADGAKTAVDKEISKKVSGEILASGAISNEEISKAIDETKTGEKIDSALARNLALGADLSADAGETTDILANAIYNKAEQDEDIVAESILRNLENNKDSDAYKNFISEAHFENADFQDPETRKRALETIKSFKNSENPNAINSMEAGSYSKELSAVAREAVSAGKLGITAYEMASPEERESFKNKPKEGEMNAQEKAEDEKRSIEDVMNDSPDSLYHAFTNSNVENKEEITNQIFDKAIQNKKDADGKSYDESFEDWKQGLDKAETSKFMIENGLSEEDVNAAYKKAKYLGEENIDLNTIKDYTTGKKGGDKEILEAIEKNESAEDFKALAGDLVQNSLTGEQREGLAKSVAQSGYDALSKAEQERIDYMSAERDKDGNLVYKVDKQVDEKFEEAIKESASNSKIMKDAGVLDDINKDMTEDDLNAAKQKTVDEFKKQVGEVDTEIDAIGERLGIKKGMSAEERNQAIFDRKMNAKNNFELEQIEKDERSYREARAKKADILNERKGIMDSFAAIQGAMNFKKEVDEKRGQYQVDENGNQIAMEGLEGASYHELKAALNEGKTVQETRDEVKNAVAEQNRIDSVLETQGDTISNEKLKQQIDENGSAEAKQFIADQYAGRMNMVSADEKDKLEREAKLDAIGKETVSEIEKDTEVQKKIEKEQTHAIFEAYKTEYGEKEIESYRKSDDFKKKIAEKKANGEDVDEQAELESYVVKNLNERAEQSNIGKERVHARNEAIRQKVRDDIIIEEATSRDETLDAKLTVAANEKVALENKRKIAESLSVTSGNGNYITEMGKTIAEDKALYAKAKAAFKSVDGKNLDEVDEMTRNNYLANEFANTLKGRDKEKVDTIRKDSIDRANAEIEKNGARNENEAGTKIQDMNGDELDEFISKNISQQEFDAIYKESKKENFGEELDVFKKEKRNIVSAEIDNLTAPVNTKNMTKAEKEQFNLNKNLIQQSIRNDENPALLANAFRKVNLVNEKGILEEIYAKNGRTDFDKTKSIDELKKGLSDKEINNYLNSNESVKGKIIDHVANDVTLGMDKRTLEDRKIDAVMNNKALLNQVMATLPGKQEDYFNEDGTLKGGKKRETFLHKIDLLSNETHGPNQAAALENEKVLANAFRNSKAAEDKSVLEEIYKANGKKWDPNKSIAHMKLGLSNDEINKYLNSNEAAKADVQKQVMGDAFRNSKAMDDKKVLEDIYKKSGKKFDANKSSEELKKGLSNDDIKGYLNDNDKLRENVLNEYVPQKQARNQNYNAIFKKSLYRDMTKEINPNNNISNDAKADFFRSVSNNNSETQHIVGIKEGVKGVGRKAKNIKEAVDNFMSAKNKGEIIGSKVSSAVGSGVDKAKETGSKIKENAGIAAQSVLLKVTKKLPEKSAAYDNWNKNLETKIQDIKNGGGMYANMTRAEREAEVAALQAKKIKRLAPQELASMGAEEQAAYHKQQQLLKQEAMTAGNYNKIYNNRVKASAPKEPGVVGKIANNIGYSFGFTGKFASAELKEKHKEDLTDIDGKIARYNATHAMRNKRNDFGDNFKSFANSYLNGSQTQELLKKTTKEFLKQFEGQKDAKGNTIDKNHNLNLNNLTAEQQKKLLQMREDAFANKLNIMHRVASSKVAKDNGVKPASYLEEKGINTANVRYKDATKKYTHVQSQINLHIPGVNKAVNAAITAKRVADIKKYEQEYKETGGNVSEKTKKKYQKSFYGKRSLESAIANQNKAVEQQKEFDKMMEFNSKFKGDKKQYAEAFKKEFGEEKYKKYNKTRAINGMGGVGKALSLENSPVAVQQRELLKQMQQEMKKTANRSKFGSAYIPASENIANVYIGKRMSNAKTKTEVALDRQKAQELAKAMSTVASQKAVSTYDSLMRKINPAIASQFEMKIKPGFAKLSEADKVSALEKYLRSQHDKATSRVHNNTMLKRDVSQLTKLNGVYVQKSQLNKGVSKTMLSALSTNQSKLYQNIVQNYNNAQTKYNEEKANMARLGKALKEANSGIQSSGTRAQAKQITEAINSSSVRLNLLKKLVDKELARKQMFERSATDAHVKAIAAGPGPGFNHGGDILKGYQLRYRHPMVGMPAHMRIMDPRTIRMVERIASQLIDKSRAELQRMLRTDSIKNRTEFKNNLKAIENRVLSKTRNKDAQLGTALADVRRMQKLINLELKKQTKLSKEEQAKLKRDLTNSSQRLMQAESQFNKQLSEMNLVLEEKLN